MRRRELLAALPIIAAALPKVEAAGGKLPRPLPNYEYYLPGGVKLDLTKYRGKVLAVDVINTECQFCQKSCAILSAVQIKYGAKGFQAIAIAINDPTGTKIPAFTKQFGLSFPVGYMSIQTGQKLLLKSAMENFYVPNLLLVDKAGMIQQYYPAGDKFFEDEEKNLPREVEKMLGLASAPAGTKKGTDPKVPAKKSST
jgi:thiol-disulfide isomerase/thioredoxin